MVETIQAQNIELYQLQEKFGLQRTDLVSFNLAQELPYFPQHMGKGGMEGLLGANVLVRFPAIAFGFK